MELRELIFFIQGFFVYFQLLVFFFKSIFYSYVHPLTLSLLVIGHVLCSAVDQFGKQFAHLEETGDKSDPVVPLDRKHASLPRYY